MILTLDEVKAYIGFEETDAAIDKRLTHLIGVAEAFLKSAIGENYPQEDPRAKEIALTVIEDLFDRGTSDKVSAMTQRLISNLCMQIRLELGATNELST